MPTWLMLADLACAILAGALWFGMPQIGPWPLLLALTPWLARFILVGRLTYPVPFAPPLALFLCTAALGVWSAYERPAAWSKFWLLVGGVCLFYAFVSARRLPATVRVALLGLFGVGLTLYFLANNNWEVYHVESPEITYLGRELQAYLPSLSGPELNPNEVGGILALLLPFTGWWAFHSLKAVRSRANSSGMTRWFSAVLAWSAFALTLFGLVMTVSRGAWVASGIALLLAGLWIAAGWLSRRDTAKRTWIFLGLLVPALIAVGGLAAIWLTSTTATLNPLLNTETFFSRLEFQRNSLLLARDYPLIGAGLDQFQMLYSTYVLLIHVGFIPHSHSLFLNVAIEQGLPGLLALIWMGGLLAVIVWRSVLRPTADRDTTANTPLVGIAALSIVIILVHGTVENALHGPGALLLLVPLAFAVPDVQEQRQGAGQRRVLSLVVLGLPLALAVLWPRGILSLVYSNLGAVHQSQAELSVYEWPAWPIQDAVRPEVDLNTSISEFELALALNPANPTANRRLAMIELSLGQYEDALGHLDAAYAAESESVTTRQLLGEALIANGRLEEGQALWTDVNNEQRQLEARAFWYGHIGDTERAAWIRQAIDGQ